MKLVPIEPEIATEREAEADPAAPAVGRWFDVTHKTQDADWKEVIVTEMACVVVVGSNYAKVQFVGSGLRSRNTTRTLRVHLDRWDDYCKRVDRPEERIALQVAEHQQEVSRLMAKVRDITHQLGVMQGKQLEAGADATQALALRGQGTDLKEYKLALIEAQKNTLPGLFEEIKDANAEMATWMSASLIPLRAEAEALKPAIGAIEQRIHHVELYAGLVEEIAQITDGHPAAMDEPLHLMQRRCYMDEECLANYTAGGMDFKDVSEFHEWLATPVNRDRILPFPRTIVAFRIRRKDKERQAFSISDFVRIDAEREADKQTFLYIRNGERVYCLATDKEFDEKLFPDVDREALNGVLWADHSRLGSDRDALITDAQYKGMIEENEQIRKENARVERERKEGLKKATTKEEKEKFHPFWHRGKDEHNVSRFVPFDHSTVYFDDIQTFVEGEVTKHNRLVLILQGLFDRSEILHPHPPYQLWTAAGFAQAIRPHYDDSYALVADEKPDFESYRAAMNATIKVGTITVGQEDLWERAEAEKESARRDRDYRNRSDYRPTHHRPHGNPGPGLLAKVTKVSAHRTVSYEWLRTHKQERSWYETEGGIPTFFACPKSGVFNVDAYRPGDYHRFFDDPRTRAEYLQWAPLLLIAEDFHAGKRTLESRGELTLEARAERKKRKTKRRSS